MGNKVTCTCGHSWNKSDSSKKDATVCHICGKDNEMKNGGWLDKYEQGGVINNNYVPTAEDGIVQQCPPGFTKNVFGQCVNAAGQTENQQYAFSQLIKNKVLPETNYKELFTESRVNPATESTSTQIFDPVSNRIMSTATTGLAKEQLEESNKSMAKGPSLKDIVKDISAVGSLFPHPVVRVPSMVVNGAIGAYDTYNSLKNKDYLNAAINAVGIVPLGTKPLEVASATADLTNNFGLENKKEGGMVLKQKTNDNYGKKDNPNNVKVSVGDDYVGLAYDTTGRNYSPAWGGQFAMGGTLPGATGHMYARYEEGGDVPGSVGFTYARTGDTPSEGPYAKKTLPSAQNGQEMQYYQEGLDWKPKNISRNGGWLDAYDVPKAQVGKVTLPVFKGFTPEMLASSQRSADLSRRTTGYASQDKAMLTEAEMKAKKIQEAKQKAIDDANELQRRKETIANSNNSKGFIEESQNAAAGEKFRFFPNDPNSFIDDYLNPLKMVGDMGDNIAHAFTRDDATFGEKALSIVNPLVAGRLAAIGTKTSGQFINNLTNPFAGIFNAKKIKDYQEGFKRVLPEKQYLTGEFSGNKVNELKKLALSLSPSTTQELGKLDANIAKEMLNDYRFEEYSTVKDFRTAVKKALLESERLKKINPNVDFSRDLGIQNWMLKKPKSLKNFADAQLMMDKSLSSQKKFLNYIEGEYNKKINLINSHDVFKNIAEESPQYTDLLYNHLKNPQVSDDVFLDNLVKQSNTFTRAVKNPINNKNEFFNISGRSITKSGKNTMDVEGFPISENYGDYRYKIEPNAEKMAEIASTPLQEKWAKRFLDNSNISNNNINLEEGWLTQKSEDYSNWFKKRRQRNNQVKNVPMIVHQPMNIPQEYLNYPQHKVFTSDLNEQVLKGFDLSELNISNKDAYKYIPGFTRGFKEGGIIQDDRGQWDHEGEVTRISGGNITMRPDPITGKPLTQPLLGIADTGEEQMMYPGQDYEFEGAEYVTEYPKGKRPKKAKNGVNQADENSLVQLDQLTNFTNYNKPTKGGWLDKY